jgi:hypothetical protein
MSTIRRKSVNFTIVPSEPEGPDGKSQIERTYANFCAVSHTPFDFTLTFCEVHPLSEADLAAVPEGGTRAIGAPVKTKIVIPVQLVAPLAAALHENLKMYQESYSNVGPRPLKGEAGTSGPSGPAGPIGPGDPGGTGESGGNVH